MLFWVTVRVCVVPLVAAGAAAAKVMEKRVIPCQASRMIPSVILPFFIPSVIIRICPQARGLTRRMPEAKDAWVLRIHEGAFEVLAIPSCI